MSRRQRRRRNRRRIARPRARAAAGAGLGIGAAMAAPAAAEAADFTVTSLADNGGGAATTLREAITAANNGGGNDSILFQSGLTGTITLNGTQLPLIDEPLQVVGPGAGMLTVSGANASRILYINTTPGDDVTVSGLKLMAGNAAAAGAGAIYSRDADLTISAATISGNKANFAGAMYLLDAGTTIERSTISGNNATSGGEGGIMSNGGGPLTIRDSTVSGNTADFAGGLYSINEEATVERATISGNKAVSGIAGGILQNGQALILRSSTLSGNTSTSIAGGIYTSSSAPDPVLTNSVVANNAAPMSPDLRGGGGDQFNASFSLIEDSAGATVNSIVAGSNLIGQDPKLGPLTDNGGPTRTHALLPGSAALDRGMASGTDQRGLTRPFDLPGVPNSGAAGANGADIGAYELALCARVPVNRIGTAGKDRLSGTPMRDGILGLGGADRLLGLAGNDSLCGGGGRDLLKGGKGRDKLLGQAGRDRLIGGPGRDRLRGGPGRDRQRQ